MWCKLSDLTAQSIDEAFHTRVFATPMQVFGTERFVNGTTKAAVIGMTKAHRR